MKRVDRIALCWLVLKLVIDTVVLMYLISRFGD
jgi:hypothetical protein